MTKKENSDFLNIRSLFIFKQFNLAYDFLEKDPELWNSDINYKKCLEIFKSLKVVNDTAERGVALIEKYNNCLTQDEEQRQLILQVVQDHRKNYSSCDKKNFVLSTSDAEVIN